MKVLSKFLLATLLTTSLMKGVSIDVTNLSGKSAFFAQYAPIMEDDDQKKYLSPAQRKNVIPPVVKFNLTVKNFRRLGNPHPVKEGEVFVIKSASNAPVVLGRNKEDIADVLSVDYVRLNGLPAGDNFPTHYFIRTTKSGITLSHQKGAQSNVVIGSKNTAGGQLILPKK